MRVTAIASVCVLLAGAGLRADTLHWVNAGGGSFFVETNWDLGRVPGATDTIVFDLAATYSVALDGDADPHVNRVEVLQGTVLLLGPSTLKGFSIKMLRPFSTAYEK